METRAPDAPSTLVIEDSVVLDSLRDWLALAYPDVRLIEISDPSNATVLNQSRSPDVVLMDISNLGKDGVARVRAMKAAEPDAPILALISLDHAAYRQAVIEAGAEGCARIWKLPTELLPKLREYLRPWEDNGHKGGRIH